MYYTEQDFQLRSLLNPNDPSQVARRPRMLFMAASDRPAITRSLAFLH